MTCTSSHSMSTATSGSVLITMPSSSTVWSSGLMLGGSVKQMPCP